MNLADRQRQFVDAVQKYFGEARTSTERPRNLI